MPTKELPLKEISIRELYNGDKATYEVPVYQRNYAWEKDEIAALIQDVYDAMLNQTCYYIGTLVSFHKGDGVYEVIDGQQRLTTIYLILKYLEVDISNRLTYRARKKSTKTLESIPEFKNDEKDMGIYNGFQSVESSVKEIVPKSYRQKFTEYFLEYVHIIHYQVPKDVDLNHYFEVMNSRGEQLEKHEIVKAQLMSLLSDSDCAQFSKIWESCSEMGTYVQAKYNDEKVFCDDQWLGGDNFDSLLGGKTSEEQKSKERVSEGQDPPKLNSIDAILTRGAIEAETKSTDGKSDTFQPIIDFSNFLLIVLKITRILKNPTFKVSAFNLDDKELLNEFDKRKITLDADFAKTFGYNLLKAKFFLDNYIVHHSNEDDTFENNPWKLQYWHREGNRGKTYPKNLCEDDETQDTLVQLLSMFEVSFTARQRKNYLFYCLLYLFKNANRVSTFKQKYRNFVEGLANKYFNGVYLEQSCLNEINIPQPGSFDEKLLKDGDVNISIDKEITVEIFDHIYGDGTEKSKGIPLFVFNYLDYRLWKAYLYVRGSKEGSKERQELFNKFGCSDFGFDIFKQFYFSRTRRSLEHFFPQADIDKTPVNLSVDQINCFGNYGMIGADANSSGSNYAPKVKLDHYLDTLSGKIKLVAVASLKFMIMLQACKDNIGKRESFAEWNWDDIVTHQKKMKEFLK